MKTLKEIKDNVAKELEWRNWEILEAYGAITSGVVDEVAKRYAKEVTKDLKMKAMLQEKSTSNKAITDTLSGKIYLHTTK